MISRNVFPEAWLITAYFEPWTWEISEYFKAVLSRSHWLTRNPITKETPSYTEISFASTWKLVAFCVAVARMSGNGEGNTTGPGRAILCASFLTRSRIRSADLLCDEIKHFVAQRLVGFLRPSRLSWVSVLSY